MAKPPALAMSSAALLAIVETARNRVLAMLHRAEQILNDEMPIIPIYYYMSRNMVKPYVRGFYNNLLDAHPLYKLWIDRSSSESSQIVGQ